MTFRVLGIAGSLRAGSHNRGLLRAAAEVAPDGIEVVIVPLDDIPLYNSDVEAAGDPPAVAALKEAIRTADALLLVTPEYNGGISGVMKNAIDWASRPPFASVLLEKPVALVSGTTGRGAGRRAIEQLRQTLRHTRSHPMPDTQLTVRRVHDRFDEEGRLVDEALRSDIRTLLSELRSWADEIELRRQQDPWTAGAGLLPSTAPMGGDMAAPIATTMPVD